MSLSTGTRLGACEILSPIGEVYRARDTKLGRDVAIKVLPEAFSQDKERLARLEREVRLLASLNRANNSTLFELEETAGTHFLVSSSRIERVNPSQFFPMTLLGFPKVSRSLCVEPELG
jgi:serine/threonine protein kinase